MNTFQLLIATPERQVLSEEVEMVKLCLPDGDYVLLAGHEPVTAALDYGLLTYRSAEGQTHEFVISDGFCEMRPDKAVVFTDQCLDADNLDREQERIERDRMIAQDRFEDSLVEHHNASIFLTRALTANKRRRRR